MHPEHYLERSNIQIYHMDDLPLFKIHLLSHLSESTFKLHHHRGTSSTSTLDSFHYKSFQSTLSSQPNTTLSPTLLSKHPFNLSSKVFKRVPVNHGSESITILLDSDFS